MFALGVLFFLGSAFLFLVFFALSTTSVAAFLGVVGFLVFVWWLSGQGGKPKTFLPTAPPAPQNPQRWGPNHIGHPAGANSLDRPDMW